MPLKEDHNNKFYLFFSNHRSTCNCKKIFLALSRENNLKPHCVSRIDFTANNHTSK